MIELFRYKPQSKNRNESGQSFNLLYFLSLKKHKVLEQILSSPHMRKWIYIIWILKIGRTMSYPLPCLTMNFITLYLQTRH